MPELPEVENVRMDLDAAITGSHIARVRVHRADILAAGSMRTMRHASNRLISGVYRRGKQLWLALDNGKAIAIHLGMSGRLTIEGDDSASARPAQPANSAGQLSWTIPRGTSVGLPGFTTAGQHGWTIPRGGCEHLHRYTLHGQYRTTVRRLYRTGIQQCGITASPTMVHDHERYRSTAKRLPRHAHMTIELADSTCVVHFIDPRRFGWVWTGPAGKLPAYTLGEDALGMDEEQWQVLMQRRRAIKALLLDQHAIAGLGNIYCDEILFSAGVHPAVRACDLDAATVKRLYDAMKDILVRAVADGGTTISDYRRPGGTTGGYQHCLDVYGRTGEACCRCGTTILRLVMSGRSTHICPSCQPARATASDVPRTRTHQAPLRGRAS